MHELESDLASIRIKINQIESLMMNQHNIETKLRKIIAEELNSQTKLTKQLIESNNENLKDDNE